MYHCTCASGPGKIVDAPAGCICAAGLSSGDIHPQIWEIWGFSKVFGEENFEIYLLFGDFLTFCSLLCLGISEIGFSK